MKSRKLSPLPSDDLNDCAAWPFEQGVEEITIRVPRYKEDGETPAVYQAIARSKGGGERWGCGIRANPVSAIQRAIESFFEPSLRDREETAKKAAEVDIEDLLA